MGVDARPPSRFLRRGTVIADMVNSLSRTLRQSYGQFGVERPRVTTLLNLKSMLVVTIEHSLSDRSVMISEDDVDRLVADPINRHNCHDLRRHNAAR